MSTLLIRKREHTHICKPPKQSGYTYIPDNFIYFELPFPSKLFYIYTRCICIYNKNKAVSLQGDIRLSIFTGLLHSIHIVKLRRYTFFFPKYDFLFNLYHYGKYIGISHDNMVVEIHAENKYEKKRLPKKKKLKIRSPTIIIISLLVIVLYLVYFR